MSIKNNPGKVFRSSQIEYTDSDRATLSESDIENAAAKKDISVIDIEALKKLLNSDNIIEDYNKYCEESAKRIVNLDNKKSMQFMRVLKELNSEKVLIDIIKSSGYKQFIDKEELLKYIQLKIDMYNSIIDSYIKMLDHNYKALKISTTQYKKLKHNLKTGKNIQKTTDKVMEYLEKNRKLWERDWGADFRKLQGGRVFMNVSENIWDICGNARSLYNMSTKWDIVILCHGTDTTPGKSLTKEEQDFVDKYKRLTIKYNKYKLSKEDLSELEDEFSEEDKKIISKYSKNLDKLIDRYDVNMNPYRYYGEYGFKTCLYLKDRLTGNLKKNWGFSSPLKTPLGIFRDVNDCIRACIADGAKSIKIMSCNPGHYEIANDIKKMTDIKVDYQFYSVLIENSTEVLTEAINLKNIINKVKNYLDSLKSKSSKIFSSLGEKFNYSIKLPFIKIKNKKPVVENKSILNKSNLAKEYEDSNKSITLEIQNIQKNIDTLNKAKELIAKLK